MQKLNEKKSLPLVLILVMVGIIGGYAAWQTIAADTKEPDVKEKPILKNISPKEAYTLIQEHQENEDFMILDVRTPQEFKQARIEEAINIDFYAKSFRNELEKLDKKNIYLVYCRSGNRSGKTLRTMKKLNFSHAYNMTGGIAGWYQQRLPIVQ
jgi:rhodanese-related sulfurtransferase